MERAQILNDKYLYGFIALIFLVGIIGHILNFTFNLMLLLTPYTLLLIGVLILIYILFKENKNIILWAFLIFIFTLLIEIVGVKTGIIFGNYYYGNILGLKLFEVPVVIGFNWTFVILGAINLSSSFIKTKFLIPFFAANLSVLFDLVLEPVAIKLNYWNWNSYDIPLQNYIAWFIISFIAALIFVKMELKLNSKIYAYYFIIQLLFFVILNIVL